MMIASTSVHKIFFIEANIEYLGPGGLVFC